MKYTEVKSEDPDGNMVLHKCSQDGCLPGRRYHRQMVALCRDSLIFTCC